MPCENERTKHSVDCGTCEGGSDGILPSYHVRWVIIGRNGIGDFLCQ